MRHFIVSMIASACLPFVGLAIVPLLGYLWEMSSHKGVVPDDPDTKRDLSNNLYGTIAGQVIAIMWFFAWNPLGV